LVVVLLSDTTTAEAEAVMIYGDSKKPVALLGLDEVWGYRSGCDNHAGFFEVDDIAYDGVSENVRGIRVKALRKDLTDSERVTLMTINTNTSLSNNTNTSLSNADRSWVSTLVSKGSKLFIAYAICGSGGYYQVRDIYRADNLEW
jgi:hypothetical protein